MNTKKQSKNKNYHYNLRSKGAPPTLEEMQEKVKWMIKKVDSLAASKKQTQRRSGNKMMDKNTFVRSKLWNNLPDNKSICSTPETLVSLPPLDYNIVNDMNKN